MPYGMSQIFPCTLRAHLPLLLRMTGRGLVTPIDSIHKSKTVCADGFSSSLPPVGGSRKRVVFLRNYNLDVIGKRFFHDISLPSASRFGFSVGVLPRDPFRSNTASVSTCMVWGNMS